MMFSKKRTKVGKHIRITNSGKRVKVRPHTRKKAIVKRKKINLRGDLNKYMYHAKKAESYGNRGNDAKAEHHGNMAEFHRKRWLAKSRG